MGIKIFLCLSYFSTIRILIVSFIIIPAVNSATSFVISSILTLLIFSGMQMYKPWIVRSPMTIIFGGYLGSLMFMFFVTVSFLMRLWIKARAGPVFMESFF